MAVLPETITIKLDATPSLDSLTELTKSLSELLERAEQVLMDYRSVVRQSSSSIEPGHPQQIAKQKTDSIEGDRRSQLASSPSLRTEQSTSLETPRSRRNGHGSRKCSATSGDYNYELPTLSTKEVG